MGLFSGLFGKKKKKSGSEMTWRRPPQPVSALDNFERYKGLTPWRDAAAAAATGAAERLGRSRSGLLSSLVMQAQNDLALGGQLNAEEVRAASQAGAAGAQTRGLNGSPQGALMRILSRAAASNNRMRERQGFAAQVAGMENEAAGLDLNTLAGAQQGALGGYDFAEGIRRFDTEREDTMTFNENQFNIDKYTADKNASAAKSSGRSSGIGGAIGGLLSAL